MKNWQLFFKYQKYLLPYIPKSVLSLFIATICLVLGMAAPLITRVLIDYAYPNKDLFLLSFLVGCTIAIFFLQQFFQSISSYLDMYVENDLTVKLKSQFYERLQKFSLRFHNNRQVGDTMFRISDDIESVVSMVVQLIAVSLQTVFQLIFLLFICFNFDWRLTLLALSGIPLYVLETKLFAKKRQEITEKELAQQSAISSYLQERIPAVKMIQAFNREKKESQTFLGKIQDFFLILRQGHIVGFLNAFADSTIRTIWLAILTWYAGYRVITGALTIGEVIAVMAYVTQIYGPVMSLGGIYQFSVRGMVSIKRIDEILSHEEEGREDPSAKPIGPIRGEILFKDVCFGYSPDKPLLKNINLEISPCQSVAIVGPSGVGKTSLIDLLQLFYKPSQGIIFVDGKDLSKVTIGSLREQISLVSQEITIFRGSIKENISYGKEDATLSDVVEAAKKAHAHEFIERLPEGYDTILEERGLNFSGGQRQRITIARALVRKPKILILDEATSAIDPESESYIHEALSHLKKECTVISIAHRLSTIIGADQIIFIDRGEIAERGVFKELMDKKGKFFEFYEMEFGNFHFFSERLHREVLRSQRYKRPLSLLMFEIRNVEKMIGAMGEEKFSQTLGQAGSLLYKIVRNIDFVAKYQKDRFLVCLPETSLAGAKLAAARIKKLLDEHVYLADNKVIKLEFASGVAILNDEFNLALLFRDCERMLETGPLVG